MTLDDVISYYVGKVVSDKVHLERHAGIKDWLVKENLRELERDEITLAALKAAKWMGFKGKN